MKHYLNRKPFMSEDSKENQGLGKTADIIINLDTLESTDVLKRENLIFQEQYDLLIKKIRRKAKENKARLSKKVCGENKKQNDEERGVPSCFFIDGTRGSGKSTLMRAVRAALIECDGEEEGLYSLADVDPTELGKGENFFLYLLSRIYRLLDERFKKNDICDEKVGQIRGAMEALRKMAGGLQVLMDSDGALKESDNPDFFLEKCVDKCADSSLLRKKLCELLGNVAKIVGKEIFLVTIDDADLNFSKCEDVLEYVRKYMQTPRLIFLFAGDMQLYSHVVRGMHIKNFREKQLKYDTSHSENRNQMQDRLEDQYLHKMFPVDNRVQTYCLKRILDGVGEPKIKRGEKDENPQTFTLYVEKYLSPFMKPKDVRNFLDVLCDMPMRSVFFYLRYLDKYEGSMQPADLATYVWTGIQNSILSSLLKYNVDYERLGAGKIEQLQKAIFRFFDVTQQWNTDLSILSASADSSAKFVALYLSGIVGQNTQTLGEKLSYWCACYPAWQAIREIYLQTNNGQKSHELVETCLKLGNDNVQSKWANLACAAMALQKDQTLSYARGTICLFNDDRIQDYEQGYVARLGMRSLVASLKRMEKNANKREKLFVLAFLSSLCRLDDERGSFYYISIYHLLMKIVELLNIYSLAILHQKKKSDTIEKAVLKETIRKHLSAMQIVPNMQRLQRNDKQTPFSNREYHVFGGGVDEKIVEKMVEWLADCSEISISTSVFDFSRSWETFMAKCAELTSSYQAIYTKAENSPRAGIILQKYMEAAEIALSSCLVDGEKNLLTQVSSFPLWEVLKNPPKDCLELLNFAYIGDYIDLSGKSRIEKLKRVYEAALDSISKIEQNEESLKQKLEKEERLLAELEQEKEEKESEQNLRKGKITEFEEKQGKSQNEIEKLTIDENNEIQQIESLTREEKREEEQRNNVYKKWEILNKLLIGENKDVVSYSVLEAELKKEQSLLERVKSDAARRKHELIIELIEDIRQELGHAEKENRIISVWNDVCTTKKSYESAYDERLNKINLSQKKVRQLKSKKLQEEKKLSEIKLKIKLFENAAVNAEIAFELAKLKYARTQKEVVGLKAELGALQKTLAHAKADCNKAEKAYKDGKKGIKPVKKKVKESSSKTDKKPTKKPAKGS